MKTYEPSAGMSIDRACREAVALAFDSRDAVQFTFNDIALRALPTDKPETLVSRWHVILAEKQEAYRKSPEGIRARAEREAQIRHKQSDLNACVEALPKILRADNHLDALMKWCEELIDPADDVGTQWNPQAVAETLEAAGYKSNEHVGQKPEWFNTRERMARYVIGQAISCMKRGMPPHPIAAKFIKEYFALPTERD